MEYGYGIWDNWYGYGTWYWYVSGEPLNNTNIRYSAGIESQIWVTSSGNVISGTQVFTWWNVQVTVPSNTIVTLSGSTWTWLMALPTYNVSTFAWLAGNQTAQWVVDISFWNGARFSQPIKIVIPVPAGLATAYVKVNHGWWATFAGLSASASATCMSGLATTLAYNGEQIAVFNNTVTIYSCSASQFVAYTETSWWGGWWGGGWGWWWGWTMPPSKDTCPNWDKSWDAYDGKCNDNNKDWEKVKIIKSRWELGSDLLIDNAYSIEFNDAYNFAFEKGITTAPTIREANMTWWLKRAHLAKMIVNYAMNVLGKTLDTSKSCNFNDLDSQNAELKWYIKQACQLWLMWVGIQSFNPKDNVSRAEFGTILSRALRWSTYNKSGNDYYSAHLKALKAKLIIKDSNPTLKERRAYVMIMLMRATP